METGTVTRESEQQVARIIVGIRACFGRLRAVADALHRDLGVTTAMRAVMEMVFEDSEHTVPDIARAKRVSRQNIQVIVDGLVAAGIAELADNPAHKRSPLVRLTAHGRATFQEMRRRERSVLKAIAEELTPNAARATLATLLALQRRLEKMETEPANLNGDSNE
jgi:DNA-binding MarR family transcriptional regulator